MLPFSIAAGLRGEPLGLNGLCPHTGRVGKTLGGDSSFLVSPTGAVHYLEAAPLTYQTDYFLEDYKNQYGKSYLEDEKNLRLLSRRRLQRIEKLAPGDSLLEFGCATGFFLDEARMAGFQVRGAEISNFASDHAREKLALHVDTVSFEDFESKDRFDVIAAFFVLEHLADQKDAFQKIHSLLNPGGLFLFALPSVYGPLFRCNPTGWKDTHPTDHFADYSPSSLRRILPLYGMELVEAWPMSFRRERACGFLSYLPDGLYRWFASKMVYGDTMEGIGRRID